MMLTVFTVLIPVVLSKDVCGCPSGEGWCSLGGKNRCERGCTTSSREKKSCRISDEYSLRPGAKCAEGYEPLTSKWQDCRNAAKSLGFSGDSVRYVDYSYPWGRDRPQGCFQSDGNSRFHFNKGAGGSHKSSGRYLSDKILCIKKQEFKHTFTFAPASTDDCRHWVNKRGPGDTLTFGDSFRTFLWSRGAANHWECADRCHKQKSVCDFWEFEFIDQKFGERVGVCELFGLTSKGRSKDIAEQLHDKLRLTTGTPCELPSKPLVTTLKLVPGRRRLHFDGEADEAIRRLQPRY